MVGFFQAFEVSGVVKDDGTVDVRIGFFNGHPPGYFGDQHRIGYFDNAEFGATDFEGVTGLDGDDILVKYTYYGDADLTGLVNRADFLLFRDGFTTKVATGSGRRGLGLALVSQTVQRRPGGWVDVANDCGALFTAFLPHEPEAVSA